MKIITTLILTLIAFNVNSQSLSYSNSSLVSCSGNGVLITTGISYSTPIPSSPSNKFWRLVIYPTGQVGAANSTIIQTPGTQNGGSLSGSTNVSLTTNYSGNLGLSAQLQYSNTYNSSPWSTSSSFSSPGNASFINVYYSNSTTNFKVNGIQNNSTSPVAIYKCNGIDNLTMSNISYGSISKYVVKVEKGLWTGSAFTATSGGTFTSPIYTTTSIPSTIDLTTLFSPNLANYTGNIRITLTTTGSVACGSIVVNKVQLFNVANSVANVDFKMKGNGCTNPNNKQTTLPIVNATFTNSPCIAGWQGAASVGYVGSNFVGTIGAITSHNIKVEEVNPNTGSYIITIMNINGTGQPPLNLDFNGYTTPAGYFLNNYTALSSSNRTFKVTVTVNTASCTDVDFSYFRIAAGNQFWKTTPGSITTNKILSDDLTIYPNPSNGILQSNMII
jgi:hypothetical protein